MPDLATPDLFATTVDLTAPGDDLSSSDDLSTTANEDLFVDPDLLPPPDFSIATTTVTADISASGTLSVTVTLTRDPGSTDLVTLAISGLPSSVTPNDVTKTLIGGTLSATFVLTAAANATDSGPHTITITGTSGALEHSITFDLTVHEPADFTLVVAEQNNGTGLSFPPNGTLNLNVTIGRAGLFVDDVVVTLPDLPAELSGPPKTFTTATTGPQQMPITSTEIFTAKGGSITVHAQSGSIIHEVTVGYYINASVDYTITLEPAVKTISKASSGSILVKIGRINGYNGPVSVTVSGLPTGVTASPIPLQIPSGQSQAPMLLTIDNTATVGGPTSVTFAAASSPNGVPKVKNATLDLTIDPEPPFTLSVPETFSVAQGTTANLAMTITRDSGFTAALSSVLLNAQSGVTATGGTFATSMSTATMMVSATNTALLLVPTDTTVSTAYGNGARTSPVAITVTPKSDAQLDASFGTGGVNVYHQQGFYISPLKLRARPDGTAILATNQGVFRLSSNGAITGNYGTGLSAWAQYAEIADNGDVYFAVRSGAKFFVSKVLASGSLDASWGTAGVVEWTTTASNPSLDGVTLRADGTVFVYGSAQIGSSADIVIARLTTAGVLDTTFSTDGFFELDLGQYDSPRSVVFPNGKPMIIAGSSGPGAANTIFLIQLTDAGVLDTTFSGDGLVGITHGGLNVGVDAVVPMAGNKLMVAGTGSTTGDSYYLHLTKVSSLDGSLDTTFDSDGVAKFDALNTVGVGALAIDSSGRIVLAGYMSERSAILRFTAAGALDTTFSGDGIDSIDAGTGGFEGYRALSVDPTTGTYWVGASFGPRLGSARYVP